MHSVLNSFLIASKSSAELIFGQQEAEGIGWELLEARMLGCYLLEVVLRKLKTTLQHFQLFHKMFINRIKSFAEQL